MNKVRALFLFAAFLVSFASTSWAMGKPPSAVGIGKKAPEFSLQREDQTAASFQEMQAPGSGKIAVICFLSYECPLSRVVVASASKFFEAHQDKITAVGISPMPYETWDTLRVYQKEQNISYDLFLDPSAELTHLFEVKEVPLFFVFDAEGVLRFRGELGGMKSAVASMLKGETAFLSETQQMGCEVPKRKVKGAHRHREIKPVEEKPKFPTETMVQQIKTAPFKVVGEISSPLAEKSQAQKKQTKTPVRFSRRWGK